MYGSLVYNPDGQKPVKYGDWKKEQEDQSPIARLADEVEVYVRARNSEYVRESVESGVRLACAGYSTSTKIAVRNLLRERGYKF